VACRVSLTVGVALLFLAFVVLFKDALNLFERNVWQPMTFGELFEFLQLYFIRDILDSQWNLTGWLLNMRCSYTIAAIGVVCTVGGALCRERRFVGR
jgi:hypothetical protein